eukprot:202726-Rhodomonas_salina.4
MKYVVLLVLPLSFSVTEEFPARPGTRYRITGNPVSTNVVVVVLEVVVVEVVVVVVVVLVVEVVPEPQLEVSGPRAEGPVCFEKFDVVSSRHDPNHSYA